MQSCQSFPGKDVRVRMGRIVRGRMRDTGAGCGRPGGAGTGQDEKRGHRIKAEGPG